MRRRRRVSDGAAVVAGVGGKVVLIAKVVPICCMVVKGLQPAKAAELWRSPLMSIEGRTLLAI
jgi:hypothetical protein